MRTVIQTFTGAANWDLAVGGKWFRLIANPLPVDVIFYRGGQEVYKAEGMEAGFFAVPDGGFDRVTIIVGAAQTVKVAISNGQGGYDGATAVISGTVVTQFVAPQHVIVDTAPSVNFNGSQPIHFNGNQPVIVKQGATLAHAAPVTVGTSATSLLAALATRKAAHFYNAGSVDVYLGGAGVTTANGVIKIAPGQSWLDDNGAAAAWYGVSGTAGQSIRIMEVRE